MEVIYLQEALNDLAYWKRSGNKIIQKRISRLVQSIVETPYEGIGKPEGLKYHHAGKWSRRITDADRIVYEVDQGKIFIHSMRGHYEK